MNVYSYDRRADTGPASRLKNVQPPISSAGREIERSKGILHGLVKELEMLAHHTSGREPNWRPSILRKRCVNVVMK